MTMGGGQLKCKAGVWQGALKTGKTQYCTGLLSHSVFAYICTELQYLQVAYRRVRLRPHVQEIPTNLQIPAELHIDAQVRQPFNDMSGGQSLNTAVLSHKRGESLHCT